MHEPCLLSGCFASVDVAAFAVYIRFAMTVRESKLSHSIPRGCAWLIARAFYILFTKIGILDSSFRGMLVPEEMTKVTNLTTYRHTEVGTCEEEIHGLIE